MASTENFMVVRFILYFQNEDGVKTQAIKTAKNWIEKGKTVKAILSDGMEDESFKTDKITSLNMSETDYHLVIYTAEKVKYYVKFKYPRLKYVKVSYFYHDQDIPANKIAKIEEVKKLVDKGKDVHAIYHDECRVITSRIVKFDIDKRVFINDCGITYYMN